MKITREESRQYITAWALFWFLINQHEAELKRYVHLLDDAGAEVEQRSDLARRTWDLAFPTLPFTAVDRALHDWPHVRGHARSPLRTRRCCRRGGCVQSVARIYHLHN